MKDKQATQQFVIQLHNKWRRKFMRSRHGEFEFQILTAVVRLGETAYGVPIRREVVKRMGRDISLGAVYETLNRLEKKRFVRSWVGDPTPERGGRGKRFFQLTSEGSTLLENRRDELNRVLAQLALLEA